MRTISILQKFFHDVLPQIHAARLNAVAFAVDAVAQGAQVAITAMGRSSAGPVRIKHRVKRMDRLIGNRRLRRERTQFYQAMVDRLLAGCTQPLILIDWSDFSADRQQQLLRASVPVGGRALTLYEELHPEKKLANRGVQHRFLERLHAMLPAHSRPIILADAGFRVPFFRHVEHLGWHWVGRIRNRDYLLLDAAGDAWIPAKSLYPRATTRARDLGKVHWVRRAALRARLVLIRQRKAHRKDRSLAGRTRRSKLSRKNARRAREPWLLVASISLDCYAAKRIVKVYKTRMQIEENFRDTKSIAYGLGIARGRHTSFARAENLLLIAALALFILWMIGSLAKSRHWQHLVRVNSSSQAPDYSIIFLARLVIQYHHERLPYDCLTHAESLAQQYLQSVFDA